jgi:hypothetical protein
MTKEERNQCGQAGRDWALANGLTAEQMGNKMIDMVDYLFNSSRPARPTYTLNTVNKKQYELTGIVE